VGGWHEQKHQALASVGRQYDDLFDLEVRFPFLAAELARGQASLL
jgi:hypothetical protein